MVSANWTLTDLKKHQGQFHLSHHSHSKFCNIKIMIIIKWREQNAWRKIICPPSVTVPPSQVHIYMKGFSGIFTWRPLSLKRQQLYRQTPALAQRTHLCFTKPGTWSQKNVRPRAFPTHVGRPGTGVPPLRTGRHSSALSLTEHQRKKKQKKCRLRYARFRQSATAYCLLTMPRPSHPKSRHFLSNQTLCPWIGQVILQLTNRGSLPVSGCPMRELSLSGAEPSSG